MYILPAIDLYDGKAVRLYKGDYANMTVYSDHPAEVAAAFRAAGAEYYLVEQDDATDYEDPFREVGSSIRYLKEHFGDL